MNICYFVNQYPKVSHTFIKREILALEELGVTVVRIAARNNPAELVDESDLEELKITECIALGNTGGLLKAGFRQLLATPGKFIKALGIALRQGFYDNCRFPFHLIYLLEACELLQRCQAKNVEHVHAHFATNSTSVAMLSHLLGGPTYSFTVHGPEEFDKPIQISLGEKIQHAAFVVAITSFCRSQLFRWCRFSDWKKIIEVHCAVDKDLISTPLKPIAQSNRFVSIGRLSEQKGQMLLLEALAILKQRGVEVVLDLVGDGELRSEIEAFIAEEKLEKNINLLGWRSTSEIVELLDNGTALLLPSFAEGLPVVIMESYARARPVLSTYIAGIPELVASDSGWLVSAGNVEAIADTIEKIVATSIEELEAMGKCGYEKVCERHNSITEAEKLLTQISSLNQ